MIFFLSVTMAQECPNDGTILATMCRLDRELAAPAVRLERPPTSAFRPGILPTTWRKYLSHELDGILFDGTSARFRWPRVTASTAARTQYCGWVNAKNRFGAYIGWKQFYVSLGGPRTANLRISTESRDDHIVDDLCASAGYGDSRPPTT